VAVEVVQGGATRPLLADPAVVVLTPLVLVDLELLDKVVPVVLVRRESAQAFIMLVLVAEERMDLVVLLADL
jgi:hypothetical protein